jgi:hypothetical protein
MIYQTGETNIIITTVHATSQHVRPSQFARADLDSQCGHDSPFRDACIRGACQIFQLHPMLSIVSRLCSVWAVDLLEHLSRSEPA